MNQADYFRSDWWDMADSFGSRERKRQLASEQLEVFDEMIRQEYKAGKMAKVIAGEHNLHIVSIYRIVKRASNRNKEMIK